jgi:hypothetical protein
MKVLGDKLSAEQMKASPTVLTLREVAPASGGSELVPDTIDEVGRPTSVQGHIAASMKLRRCSRRCPVQHQSWPEAYGRSGRRLAPVYVSVPYPPREDVAERASVRT